jgi:hypothetical protein
MVPIGPSMRAQLAAVTIARSRSRFVACATFGVEIKDKLEWCVLTHAILIETQQRGWSLFII